MTARHDTLICPAGQWTRITDTVASGGQITLTVNQPVRLKATAGTTAPSDDAGAIFLQADTRAVGEVMGDLFPGLSGADELWVLPTAFDAKVMISHA